MIYHISQIHFTRHISTTLLLPSQCAVFDYGLRLDVVRLRFQEFRSDVDAVSKACGSTLLRVTFKTMEPGSALIRFLEGIYIMTESERVHVLSGDTKLCNTDHYQCAKQSPANTNGVANTRVCSLLVAVTDEVLMSQSQRTTRLCV